MMHGHQHPRRRATLALASGLWIAASALEAQVASLAPLRHDWPATVTELSPWMVEDERTGLPGSPRPQAWPTDDVTPATLAQRFALGSAVAGAAAAPWALREDWGMAAGSYIVGSAAGVILAAHRREGARPSSALLGAALGGAPFYAAAWAARAGSPAARFLATPGLVTAPLGAAWMP